MQYTHAVISITPRQEFLEQNNITAVNTIVWNMSVRALGDYSEGYKISPVIYSVEAGGQ